MRKTRDGHDVLCQAIRIFSTCSGRHCVSVLDLMAKSGRPEMLNGRFIARDYELAEPCERLVYVSDVQFVALPPPLPSYHNAKGILVKDSVELKRLESACLSFVAPPPQ